MGKQGGALGPRSRASLIGAVLTIVFVLLLYLSVDVSRKLDNLATADTDTVQWSLSQVEVEFLHMKSAMQAAQIDWTDPRSVRRRYDVFYSRIIILQQSELYADLRADPVFLEQLDAVRAMLDDTVQIIDGDDEALRAALPDLIARVEAVHPSLRNMSLSGISFFVTGSTARRAEISTTLGRVAGLTALTFVMLGMTLVALFRAFANAQQRAAALEVASSRLSAVVSTALDAVVVVDRQGKILDFNPAAETIFGYRRDEVVGQDMARVMVPPHLRASHSAGMDRHLQTGEKRLVDAGRVELEAMRRDGSVFPVEMAVSTARSRGRDVYISFLRDISNRRAAEEALLKARDDALAGEKAKADLLAVMSHEIRTPLNGMIGTLDLLADTPMNAEQREFLRLMNVSGRQLLHHVNDVLDITRLDGGITRMVRAPFDLTEMVQELVASFQATALAGENRLVVTGIDAPLMVLGDVERLRQVLANLVGNALKFTRAGTVRVEVERGAAEDLVNLRVIDTGIGIKAEDLERIFDDFVTLDTGYSRQAGGTGLGLGIVRRIMDAQGGKIEVVSEPGQGTKIELELKLPSVEETVPQSRTIDAKGQEISRILDVLVVEDNAINRVVLRRMLERAGHQVDEAHDGDEGVSMAEQYAYDLILMDISMPRVNGVDATRAIRDGGGPSCTTQIIATTAHALPADRKRFMDAGMNGTLVKPITQGDLAEVLRSILSEGALGQDSAAIVVNAFDPDLVLVDAPTIGSLVHALGSEAVGEILQTFRAQGEEAMEETRASLEHRTSHDQLGRTLHKLAGSAGVIGAQPLALELGHIDLLIRTGQAAKLRERLIALPQLWERTTAYLQD